MPSRKQCPVKGCKNLCESTAHTCMACRRQKLAETGAARERRLAEGRPTPEDVLRDENAELRARGRSLEEAIKTYRAKARVEDRLVTDIVKFIEASPYRPQLRPAKTSTTKGTPHEMLALVSDAHYPEVVDPKASFGLVYNGDICMRRLEYLRDKIIRYRQLRATSYPTRKLTVAVNGDMLSGNIHEELEVTNEAPIGEALVKMAYALFDMGLAFRSEFEAVEFVVMPGNHPRLTRKPRLKDKWNNWEWVLGMFLRALANGKFDVTVPKDLVYVHEVFQQRIGITHGDGVKSASFAGIPFYGLKQRRDALQGLLKTLRLPQLDMLCYGHFHQLLYENGAGCAMVINGSIKGGDEYVISTRYSSQEPVQALLTFHERHGMTDLSRINLAHIT